MRNLFILMLILGVWLAACSPAALSADAQAEIYAAAIQQQVTVDDTFGGSLNPDYVYIISTTNDRVGDPDGEQLPPTQLNEALQAAISANLSELEATLLWIPSRETVEINPETGEVVNSDGVGVIVTVGNLQPQADGSVHLSTSIYIANLAAGGQTYILEEIDGVWQVTGTTGAAWIS